MKKALSILTAGLILATSMPINALANQGDNQPEVYVCPITVELDKRLQVEEPLNVVSGYIVTNPDENARTTVSGSRGIYSWTMTNFSNELLATGRSEALIRTIETQVWGNYSGTTPSEHHRNQNPTGSTTRAISARVNPRPGFRFISGSSSFVFLDNMHGNHLDRLNANF